MERFYPQLKDSEKSSILDSLKEELDTLNIDTSKASEDADYSEDDDIDPEEEEE